MLGAILSSLAPSTATTKQLSTDDCSSIISSLNLEQTVDMMISLPEEVAYRVFFLLDNDKQDHVFPLLAASTRELILSSSDRCVQLQEQLDCFLDHAERMEEEPDSANSFFYMMALHNAQKCRIDDKISYFITADKLQTFNLKPYKYQRKLMEKHVQTIVEGINKSNMLYHPIVLCYIHDRNSLTIMDGQHRWNALKRLADPQLVTVQVDVILCEDDDEEAMQIYKNINTNVPIDHTQLKDELKYIALVEKIRIEFGSKAIRNFNKELKEVPQHLVVDSMMKEELQYRSLLAKYTPEQIIQGLKVANELLASEPNQHLSLIDSKICKRERMYLGVMWPKAIDKLEEYLATC